MKLDSSNAVQILLLVGGISLVPAILFTVTGFTRILIVLGFIRSAIGTQSTPPNQVLIGIALFLTLFVMQPTISQIKTDAWDPLVAHHISTTTALKRVVGETTGVMLVQVRPLSVVRSTVAPTPR